MRRKCYSLLLPGGQKLVLGRRTLVMGIVNVTPDSFADGGCFLEPSRAADHALALQEAGADLLDIGGESTRPGSEAMTSSEELRRIVPVLEKLDGFVRVPLSVDTYKAAVANVAIDHGVSMVNDVSALTYDADLARVVSERGVPIVLMHIRWHSREMYREATYGNVTATVFNELQLAIKRAVVAGVPRSQIVIDPGLGFAKRSRHSMAALANLVVLAGLDRPILVGPSRKSFLTAAIGDVGPSDREWATAGAVASAVLSGAHIVRVHAVAEQADVVRTVDAIRSSSDGPSDPSGVRSCSMH